MSASELHARASEIFLTLRELPEDQRGAALRTAAGGDERLIREVESLLAHDSATADASQDDPDANPLEAPETIGPYRVIQRIGRGGSGQVLLARQEEPIRRNVAIKVVPAAAVSPELAARFDVERRALECTEHPHIARILDTGRTDDGLPYLVMDLIDGVPITEYCRTNALSLVERLRLILPIADALQHAHQRGVVHRDVKPANLLVSDRDGHPFPTVLDFGIAKPVAGDFADESPATSGLPLGTPSYMAPEQTGVGTVDVRTDVYGLGAVLYELVTGHPPIERKAEKEADPLALLRSIREDVPAPASRRLTSELGAASRAFLADLDLILARTLEKDPDRRYGTMEALTADLRRLLSREAIAARPPSWGYRLARFAERNKVLVAAGTVVLLALVVGVIGLTAGLQEAREQQALALREEEAQREINRFLTDDLLFGATPDQLGAEVKARDLLKRASERIDDRFPARPLIAAEIHHTLATAFAELGDYDAAEGHAARALELRVANAGADSPDAVRTEIVAADLIARRENYAEGKAVLVPLVARARLILGPDDPELYTALNDLGVCLESLGELEPAREALEESLLGRRRLLEPHDREIVTSLGNLALVRDRQGDLEASLSLMEEALELAENAPEISRYTLMVLYNNLGATYQDYDRDQEAVPYLRRAAELAGEALAPDHPAAAGIRLNLAGLEAELGDPLKAAELYDEVVRFRTKTLGPTSEGTIAARYGYWDSLRLGGKLEDAESGLGELLTDAIDSLGDSHWLTAQTTVTLAICTSELGRTEDALYLAEEALMRMTDAYGPGHSRTRSAEALYERLETQLNEAESP